MTFEDKISIHSLILTALRAELAGFTRAAKEAQAAATDPGSKAENKYDTRNLEASYLARGVAFRVAETEAALTDWTDWTDMPLRDFTDRAAAVGALVVLEDSRGVAAYFLGPGGGGTAVLQDEIEVTVLTTASPLGKQLLKRREGEVFLLESGSRREETVVAAVV